MRSSTHLHSYQVCVKWKKENRWDNSRFTILGHWGRAIKDFIFYISVRSKLFTLKVAKLNITELNLIVPTFTDETEADKS